MICPFMSKPYAELLKCNGEFAPYLKWNSEFVPVECLKEKCMAYQNVTDGTLDTSYCKLIDINRLKK